MLSEDKRLFDRVGGSASSGRLTSSNELTAVQGFFGETRVYVLIAARSVPPAVRVLFSRRQRLQVFRN